MMKCKCGCGCEVSKKGNIYIHGHNHRGKTYEEIYGNLAEEYKKRMGGSLKGKPRKDMLGEKNIAKRPEVRKKIKKGVKNSWIRNPKSRMTEKINKRIRKTNEELGVWIKEKNIDRFELYKRKVKKHTNVSIKEKYSKKDLKNIGRSKHNDTIDHIFSIQKGFINGILPQVIGCKSNLRIISKIENSIKHTNCDIEINELFKQYDIEVSL